MPRQCISKRNKNIKEREKTYNPVTFLQKSANNFLKMCNFSYRCKRKIIKFVVDAFESMPRADYISTLAHDRQKFDQ